MTVSIKEKIILAATELIKTGNGNINKITTRAIAEKAGVGVGLINYHFQTKENLTTLCVQRIISTAISQITFPWEKFSPGKERLTELASYVFEFLYANPAVSRISILGDLTDYQADCNSVKSRRGTERAIEETLPENDKKLLSFLIVSAMQVTFLSSDFFSQLPGFDLSTPQNRKKYITKLISVLYDGVKNNSSAQTNSKN